MLWVDKYSPKTFNDIFLTSKEIQMIKKWIEDFKNKKKKASNCLFLYGAPGIGKSSIANIVLKEYNYDILEFNASDVRNAKLIKDQLGKVNGNVNVLDCMCYKKKEIGIILDELDGLSSGEKSGLTEIINIIFDKKMTEGQRKTPFICISNTINKKLDSIRKKSVELKIGKPSRLTLKKIVNKICKLEKLNIDEESKDYLINVSQLDIRRIITMLEYLVKNNKLIRIESTLKILDNYDKKNMDLNLYEITEKLLNKYHTIDETYYYFSLDKTMVGLYMYENFPNFIVKNRKESAMTKINAITDIYDNYVMSNMLDYNIFIHQKYGLSGYNSVLKCNIPSHIINNMKKYSFNRCGKINYSTLVNKSSQEYLNCKSVNKIKRHLTFYSNTNNHINICNLFYKYLIQDENIEKVNELVTTYNIDDEILDKIIKCSRLYSNDKGFSTKLKKLIKAIYSHQIKDTQIKIKVV